MTKWLGILTQVAAGALAVAHVIPGSTGLIVAVGANILTDIVQELQKLNAPPPPQAPQ